MKKALEDKAETDYGELAKLIKNSEQVKVSKILRLIAWILG